MSEQNEKPQTVMPGYLVWVVPAALCLLGALVFGGLDLAWHLLKWIFG
jgi:hypothetical protein